MQFMLVYHPGPEGLGINVPLRAQHGPTPGVKVLTAWVSGGNSPTDARTYIVIETDTIEGISGFIFYMQPYDAALREGDRSTTCG